MNDYTVPLNDCSAADLKSFPKAVAGCTQSLVSFAEIGNDIFGIPPEAMSPTSVCDSENPVSLLDILDEVEFTLRSEAIAESTESSRKELGRLYSTMPVRKPERRYSFDESIDEECSSPTTTCSKKLLSPRRFRLLKQRSSFQDGGSQSSSMPLRKPERKVSSENLFALSMASS